MHTQPAPVEGSDIQWVAEAARARDAVRSEIAKVIVGQREVVDLLLVSLFSQGHGLFIGVPGLAKTLLVHTLADTLALEFKRVQFTPDLMPSDITGTEVLEEDRSTGRREFRFLPGPVFTHILLADEINRASPKTQAALLQAMQEGKVTVAGQDHPLPRPFLVYATQNPVEQEGTYPLPEAQLDRFLFSIEVDYPDADEEVEVVRRTTAGPPEPVAKVLTPEQIARLQDLVPRIPVPDVTLAYAVRLVRATRPGPEAPRAVNEFVAWGAGPRAAQHLISGAKARAMLDGRFAAGPDDVTALVGPVLKHRIVTNFRAEAQGVGVTEILDEVVRFVPRA
ncbi:AAA family ATPase [Deferrisoma camini]|uniref:AAA family ATPase n=1 Tax=Deferrisoma camini TaxID=1035120 RepID=UPI00046D4F41|nr:MoxR family ATPase [Deferrisoma camini]